MKSFAATCVIFSLIIGAIWVNSFYINHAVDEMITVLESADPSDPAESQIRLQELQSHWIKERKYIQASISHLKIDTVTDLLSSLLIYNKYSDREEYEKTAALLRAALEELRLLEKISAENIL